MKKHNAMTEKYELVDICGVRGAFSNNRIEKETVPDGFHLYEIQHDDMGYGCAVGIGYPIRDNFLGSVITAEAIHIPRKSADGIFYKTIDFIDDLVWLGCCEETRFCDKDTLLNMVRQRLIGNDPLTVYVLFGTVYDLNTFDVLIGVFDDKSKAEAALKGRRKEAIDPERRRDFDIFSGYNIREVTLNERITYFDV